MGPRALIPLAVLGITLTAPAVGDGRPGLQLNPPETSALTVQIEAFFRTDDIGQRATLLADIEKAAGGSVGAVREALGRVQLWPAVGERGGTFTFQSVACGTIGIEYRLPADYDPARRHPMLIAFPSRGQSPRWTLDNASRLLGEALRAFVLICPARAIGSTFCQPVDAAGDLLRLMHDVRRRFHVDTDRVFVYGYAAGGNAAWFAAIAHPDLFAGAIILSAYPDVPYAQQVYPLLLPNLRNVHVLTTWSEWNGSGNETRNQTVDIRNRMIEVLADKLQLPIVGRRLEGASPGFPARAAPGAVTILDRRRPGASRHPSKWFRYPAQGSAGWLKQTKFMGDVWTAGQLSVLASVLSDRNAFITSVIKEKLAYLGGRVDGQTIAIQTRRCARIELLLPDGLVTFSKPVTVRCNGRKRFEGLVRPSIRTLLQDAYARWEFQHPAVAKLSFSIRAHGRSPE